MAVWDHRYNQRDNPILASDLAELLLTVATGGHRGVFHLCGRDSVTRLELAQLVAETFGYDASLVRPATAAEMDERLLEGVLTAPRDTRMQFAASEQRLGRTFPALRDGLDAFRRQVEAIQART